MATNTQVFSDLFSWRRTTTIQKIIFIGGVLFVVSLVSGWWSIWIVYMLTLPLTWKMTQLILTRQQAAPTDKLLLFIQTVNRVVHSISSMGSPQKQSKDKYKASRSGSVGVDVDIGRAKDVSRLKGQTVDGEVRIFVKYVVRDFVQSWYEDFSHDTQTLKESQQILLNVAENLTKRGQKINPQRLTTDLILLYKQHLIAIQIAKSVYTSQKWLSGNSDLQKLKSVDEAFEQKIGFHPALKNSDSESNFLRSLSKLVLTHILPSNIEKCHSPVIVMTELVACNVLKSAIDMLTDSDWLYESMIILMTDNESEESIPPQVLEANIQGMTGSSNNQSVEQKVNVHEKREPGEGAQTDANDPVVRSPLNIPEIRLQEAEEDETYCDVKDSNTETQDLQGIDRDKSNCDKTNEEEHVDAEEKNSEKHNVQEKETIKEKENNQEKENSHEKESVKEKDNVHEKDNVQEKDHVQEKEMNKSELTLSTESNHTEALSESVEDSLPSDPVQNHVVRSGSLSEKPKKASSTISLFSLFTRRKGSRSDSTKSTRSDSAASSSSEQTVHPRQSEETEVFVQDNSPGLTVDSVLGVECSEEAGPVLGDSVAHFMVGDDRGSDAGGSDVETDIMFDDSSLFFQDISVPETEERNEFRSSSKYTLYVIEYNALYFADGPPVLKGGSVKRRFREFVNLQSRLENNSAYKKPLKDVKGPSRWNTLPFKNMDKESIETRRVFLEKYMKTLIQIEAICNGPELREFLAYEGDGHIAFVKRAPEISVPRLDKMLARTVSGVFEKIKSIPDIPQNVISAVTKRDRSVERLDNIRPTEDTDRLNIEYDWLDGDTETTDNDWTQALENILSATEKYSEDEEVVLTTSELDSKEKKALLEEIHARLPRSQGDGSEAPPSFAKERKGQLVNELPIAHAVLDLALQTIQGQEHWLTRERVFDITRIFAGKALERWLSDKIGYLTTPERWVYYSQLLREAIWPAGELSTDHKEEKSQTEKQATRDKAKHALKDFFPDVFHQLAGDAEYEKAARQIMESLERQKLNKHFLYTFLEILTEKLFPEITAEDLQENLLT